MKIQKVLLDTNIIIERENPKEEDSTVATLYKCLDKLHCEKFIHPSTENEISKYGGRSEVKIVIAKLNAYERIANPPSLPVSFLLKIEESGQPKDENDLVDDELLFQVFDERMDCLITQDKRLLRKSVALGIKTKVMNIEEFLSLYYKENPDLIFYKALAVRKGVFSDVDLSNNFFDSFRADYHDFDKWFKKKCNEPAYYCRSDSGETCLAFFI